MPSQHRLYGILSHPIRVRILELLGDRGPTGFTGLRAEIPVSVGSLYYHISVLGELLTQDEKKRYLLTDLGIAALKHLRTQRLGTSTASPKAKLTVAQRVTPLVSGAVAFQWVSLSPLRHLAPAASVVALGGWLTSLAGLNPRLLFLFESPVPPAMPSMVAFVIGWLAIYALSDLAATKAFRSNGGHVGLLVNSGYSLLPLMLFTLIWLYHKSNPSSFLASFDGWPLRVLFLVLQAWTLLLLSSSISVSKRLSSSKAFATVLLLIYLNIALVLPGRIP